MVFLGSGKRLPADMVVLAVGVRPETTLARAAGLALWGGAAAFFSEAQESGKTLFI